MNKWMVGSVLFVLTTVVALIYVFGNVALDKLWPALVLLVAVLIPAIYIGVRSKS